MTRRRTTVADLVSALNKFRGGLRAWEAFELSIERLYALLANQRGEADRIDAQLEKSGAGGLLDGFVYPLMRACAEAGLDNPDIIGQIAGSAMSLNGDKGQYFTPREVSNLTAALAIDREEALVSYRSSGIVSVYDPTVGSGCLLLAAVSRLVDCGVPLEAIYAEGQDIDPNAWRMACVQLSLAGVRAQVILGNTLTLEFIKAFATPAMCSAARRSPTADEELAPAA